MADISKIVIPSGDEFNLKASSITDSLKATLVDLMYPIGSIYMSVSSTNPGTIFGVGTWEAWGSGRVPVGVDSNDTSFDTVEETGGNKSNSYTPAGTNSGCAVTAHTYTPAGTVGGHTLTAAESGMPRHRHSGTSLTVTTTDIEGAFTFHGVSTTVGGLIGARTGVLNPTDSTYRAPANHYKTQFDLEDHTSSGVKSYNGVELSAAHSHDINGYTGYAGGTSGQAASDSHSHSWTGTKATLSHTVTQPTFSGTQASLTHTVTQPTFTGTTANISTVQPYITCYMWKRTA